VACQIRRVHLVGRGPGRQGIRLAVRTYSGTVVAAQKEGIRWVGTGLEGGSSGSEAGVVQTEHSLVAGMVPGVSKFRVSRGL